ncbi:MAG: hypothetical protein EAX90_03400 [Candidatus Heimdallarchaeota archaeon]|nr:hypothetical protein [Candidatus Heimdallarchaeota archaeon]
MSQKVTPDMLKSKFVFDINGIKAGIVKKVVRDQYKKLTMDFLEIELEKKINIGFKTIVKVRTRDATLREDGNVNVKFTKEQLKVMSKEQELQRHPPTI